MTAAINVILGLLTEHWLVVLIAVVGLALIVIAARVLRSLFPSPRRRGPGLVVTRVDTPIIDPDRDERENPYEGTVEDLKADNLKYQTKLTRLTNRTAVLAPFVKELKSHSDTDRLGPIILRVLERLFEPKQALVFVVDKGGEKLVLASSFGVSEVTAGFRQRVGDGFAGTVAKKQVLLWKRDVENESNLVRRRLETTEPTAFRSEIGVPLVGRAGLLGVICMGGVGEFTEDDEAIFAMIADLSALSLTNYYQHKRLQKMANSDPLTGVLNKQALLGIARESVVRARAKTLPHSLLMVDLDHFRHFNETNGHLAGDRLLQRVSGILADQVRPEDTIGRFGGEEFVIVLNDADSRQAAQVARRIRGTIAGCRFEHGGSQPLGHVSVSIGVASMPDDGKDLESLLHRGNLALSEAKRRGRDRVVTASDTASPNGNGCVRSDASAVAEVGAQMSGSAPAAGRSRK